jgi:hypothetical protein
MTFRQSAVVLIAASLALAACYSSRPIVDPSSGSTSQEGTIAGHVSSDGNAPVVNRIVRAVPVDGTTPYETTTGEAGSYTMKVRPGRYRLELSLHQGERIVEEPGETNVNPSDLDPDRDFVISTMR